MSPRILKISLGRMPSIRCNCTIARSVGGINGNVLRITSSGTDSRSPWSKVPNSPCGRCLIIFNAPATFASTHSSSQPHAKILTSLPTKFPTPYHFVSDGTKFFGSDPIDRQASEKSDKVADSVFEVLNFGFAQPQGMIFQELVGKFCDKHIATIDILWRIVPALLYRRVVPVGLRRVYRISKPEVGKESFALYLGFRLTLGGEVMSFSVEPDEKSSPVDT